jgi:hypothetical protein
MTVIMKRLAALLLALTIGGCGSTVQQHGEVALGSDRQGTDEAVGAGEAGLDAGGGGASTSGTATGASAARRQAGATKSTVPAAAAGRVVNGPGVTDTSITIGVTYYQNASAANAALGARDVDTGDPVAATRLLVKDINAHGGVAGRKLEILLFPVDPQSSTPYAAEAQALCTHFTQDHKVFAVVDGTPAADARACLEQHGVAYIGGTLLKNFLYPHEFDPYSAGTARVYAALVPALLAQNWFAPWDRVRGAPGTTRAKVGIVTVDDPRQTAIIDNVLVKGLRDAGYAPDPDNVIRITPPGGFTDDGAVVAQIDNAALKLNADGVDHVILDDNNGSLALLFTNYAFSQRYFPRYGGTSGNAWQVLLSTHNIQPDTLRGAIGIGWQPLFDLPYQNGDGAYSNAARHACLKLFADNGMAATDAATAGGQAEGCDVVYFLPAAFGDYRGPVNAAVFKERAEALGTTYPLASGLGSRFGRDQHDGAGGFAVMRFDAACSCVSYVGAPRPF